VERARRGEGPTLIEYPTYRWFGHHEGDPGTSYRSKEEIEAWKQRDPVKKLRQQALTQGWVKVNDLEEIDADVSQRIEEAAEFALRSPLPGVSTALHHVFST
jgi:pyruvate dehydrogenase E1 component alpha subunit